MASSALSLPLPLLGGVIRASSLLPKCPSTIPSVSSKSIIPLPLRKSTSRLYLCSATPSPSLCRRFSWICPALDSDASYPTTHNGLEREKSFAEWDSLTAKFAGASNFPFLLLQLPQIILNAKNLMAGNKYALFAVPWLGMLTGLMGNLSLLSYFANKREIEAIFVQTLGVVSIYVVLAQLAMAEAMPLPQFIASSIAVASGLVLNFLNYFNLLDARVWQFWEDFITVGGLSVLPQVIWSTFVPYIPNSILPGTIAFVVAVLAVFMARTGKLPQKSIKFAGSISGWTATLLFMWMPIAQMWTSFINPDNIKGLSAFSMLLAMIGNGLMIPRALFIRDLMWFTGSSWASFLYGWGNLLCMYCFNSISREFFLAATVGLYTWAGFILFLLLHIFTATSIKISHIIWLSVNFALFTRKHYQNQHP